MNSDTIAPLFLLLLIVLAASMVLYSLRLGISPMPSSRKAKEAIALLLPEQVEREVYELGAGWGTLLPLLEKYPHALAFELSPLPWLISRLRAPKNVSVLRKDFFQHNLSDAGLVVCYLFPRVMARLKVKFEKELPEGCWVVSNTFAVPGWVPVKVVVLDDLYKTKVYLYRRT